MLAEFKLSLPTDKKLSEYLHVATGSGKITGRIRLVNFIDNGHHIAYIPSLKLTAYGDSKGEAIERLMKDVVDDFFTNLVDLDVLHQELKRLGWARNTFFKRRFLSNTSVDKDGILQDFNLPKGTEVEMSVLAA